MRLGNAAYKGDKPDEPGKSGKTREIFLIPAAFRNGKYRPDEMQKHDEEGDKTKDDMGVQSETVDDPQKHY